MADFLIVTRTGAVDHGGTDFDVHARVQYNSGAFSDWKVLNNPGNDREQGDVDGYLVSFPSGNIKKLELRVKHAPENVNKPATYDDWYLTWAAVAEASLSGLKDGLFYHPNEYFSVPKGDTSWHTLKIGSPKNIPFEIIGEMIKYIV
jgi:hypothetical protein